MNLLQRPSSSGSAANGSRNGSAGSERWQVEELDIDEEDKDGITVIDDAKYHFDGTS